MYNLDAIEGINFEQLATATDRLLLRGRPSKRPSAASVVLRHPAKPVRRALRSALVPVALLTSLFWVTVLIVNLF